MFMGLEDRNSAIENFVYAVTLSYSHDNVNSHARPIRLYRNANALM